MNKLAENTVRKQRGRPFVKGQSGNPCGRPAGSFNRVTKIAQSLIDSDVEEIFKTLINNAKQGDPSALRLAVERILPRCQDRPIEYPISEINSGSDAAIAINEILKGVSSGLLTPSEGQHFVGMIESAVKISEVRILEERISALELAVNK